MLLSFFTTPLISSFELNGKHMCLQGLFLLPFKAVRGPRNHFMALKESGRYAEGTKLRDGAHMSPWRFSCIPLREVLKKADGDVELQKH